MALIKVSGKASVVKTVLNPTYVNSPVRNTSSMTFRIDNRPISMGGTMDITDGDQVTLVAEDNPQGGLYVLALRNETTGAVNLPYEPTPKLNIIMMLIGIPLIPIILGIPMVLTPWVSYKNDCRQRDFARQVKQMMGS